MLNSTQDISVIDQVCIRCVLNEPNECLLCVTPSHCGTGEGLFQLLKNALEIRKIVLTNCIADSTDGAANVSGIYNGLQAKTKESVPNHVYIRCDAHALNPVVYDSCTLIPALSLSDLVEKPVISFRDSYTCMDAWRDMIVKCQIGTDGQKRLQMISNTRWSSKSRAVTHIFGSFQDSDSSVYLVIIRFLTYLLHSNSQSQSIRTQTAGIRDKLLEYNAAEEIKTHQRTER